MYAHVNTYRLSTSNEAEVDIWSANTDPVGDYTISDQTARTVASWYQSPRAAALAALASGAAFYTTDLRDDLERAGMYPQHYAAMYAWLDMLEQVLEEDA